MRRTTVSVTKVGGVNQDQDHDVISAHQIEPGDTIEFPSDHPYVKWYAEEGMEARCNEPGVKWYVEEEAASVLGTPAGDLYKFTVQEVGAGGEADVQIGGHLVVRRYHTDR